MPLLVATELLLVVKARHAYAQLGPNGSSIRTSRYSVDLFQGPVIASTRVIGMGGAYVAIAERVEGSFYNPAAPAVRMPWSRGRVDVDGAVGFTSPGTLQRSDFFNSGSDRTNLATSDPGQFVFMDAEGHLQVDEWGFGAGVQMQQYRLNREIRTTRDARTDQLNAQVYVMLAQVARATADGQLIVGLGLRPLSLNVANLNPSAIQPPSLFTTRGVGYSAGFLWRPNDAMFRVGASFNSAVTTRVAVATDNVAVDANGNHQIAAGTADEMYLPEQVTLPWELDLGVAVQFGERPFNPRWIGTGELLRPLRRRIEWRRFERQRKRKRLLDEAAQEPGEVERLTRQLDEDDAAAEAADEAELDREKFYANQELKQRERRMGRWYILVTTSLRLSGAVRNGVGIESFLQRVVDRSGARTVASPHLGLESEVIANWLKLRAGVYGEPTRFDNANAAPRLHTTVGFEQKIFYWRVFGLFPKDKAWRIQGAADFSERYFGWSAAVGVWY
ncbi:MAG TPA: hypothetical protein VKP30_20930 [Polyangiaceae bacterium]|nr:hypothetical protein [Polyangiaceae bacterium]